MINLCGVSGLRHTGTDCTTTDYGCYAYIRLLRILFPPRLAHLDILDIIQLLVT